MANKTKKRKAYRAGGITKKYSDKGNYKKAGVGDIIGGIASIFGAKNAANIQSDAVSDKYNMLQGEYGREDVDQRREDIMDGKLAEIPGLVPDVSPTLDAETAAIPGRFSPVEDVSTEALDKQRELQSQKMSEATKAVSKSAGTKGALGLGNLLRAGREGDVAIMKDQMESDERTRQLEKDQEKTVANMQHSTQMSKAGQEFSAQQALSQATLAELSAIGAKEDALMSAELANINEQAQADIAKANVTTNIIQTVAGFLPFEEGGKVKKMEDGGMPENRTTVQTHLDAYYGSSKNLKNMADSGTVLNVNPEVVMNKQYIQGENKLPAGKANVTTGKFSHDTNPIDIVQEGEKIGEMTGGEVIMPNRNVNQFKTMLASGDKAGVSKLMSQLLTKWESEADGDSEKSLNNEGVPEAGFGKWLKKAAKNVQKAVTAPYRAMAKLTGADEHLQGTKVGGALGIPDAQTPQEAAASAVEEGSMGTDMSGGAVSEAEMARARAMKSAGVVDPSMMGGMGMPGMMGGMMGGGPGGMMGRGPGGIAGFHAAMAANPGGYQPGDMGKYFGGQGAGQQMPVDPSVQQMPVDPSMQQAPGYLSAKMMRGGKVRAYAAGGVVNGDDDKKGAHLKKQLMAKPEIKGARLNRAVKLKSKEPGEKVELTPSQKRDLARQERIARNIEFNAYAEQQGLKPPTPQTDEEMKEYIAFYSNKDNVNFLNQKQEEYFSNKKNK